MRYGPGAYGEDGRNSVKGVVTKPGTSQTALDKEILDEPRIFGSGIDITLEGGGPSS